MPGWKPIVGKSFDAAGFEAYCASLSWDEWKPSFIAIHNTANPDLAMRPKGFEQKHMGFLEHYYKNDQKWSAGPHLFVDDHRIWVFTPLTTKGRHSPSWNETAIGIEMLGNYDKDSFSSGRGLAVRRNAVKAAAILSKRLGLPADSIRFHKEDKATTHRDCPGKNVLKPEFVAEVKAAMAA